MMRIKAETISIRTTSEIKEILRLAAERERRSVASMIEVLILQYASSNGIASPKDCNDGKGEA